MRASVVIRTYNEETHLGELLAGIADQETRHEVEVVLVDSGSTDRTLDIARQHHCHIVNIRKEDFTFGRSLNYGCEAATGDALVFVSGHCVPASASWLEMLLAPIDDGVAAYTYGRQIGRDTTKFSEQQVFEKYFPAHSQVPQEGYFCNNANAALLRDAWVRYAFDETLTGLEDLHLAKRLHAAGNRVAYVAEAPVYHIHDESWRQVRIRYEREAIALRHIMPEIHVSWTDALRYFASGVLNDLSVALAERNLGSYLGQILVFRCMQYYGTYRGNLEHRKLSARRREEYFYPTQINKGRTADAQKTRGTAADEGSQRTGAS